ncbi:MAG: class I SAM-dependent methyltransferase [Ignavibacteriae bacterium]|nr:class I SAM-dependent methyltransferase [Ignavibacteriota bacterium]
MTDQTRNYWQYEYDVAAKYMIPLLEQWGALVRGTSVIDVGCGEGGGLCAMFDAGAAACHGFDIEVGRVEAAKELKGERPLSLTLGNLYEAQLPFTENRYDLVVLHDVFEHLERKDEVMQKLAAYAKPSGRIMITFPPYYSAYGAHQQLLRTSWAKLPFFHLLPFTLSKILPRLKGEHPYYIDEITKLGKLKMGMKKFEAIVARNGLSVAGKQAYLISPNHIRFGLKPLPAGKVSEIPILGEVVCTGVVYLLRKF